MSRIVGVVNEQKNSDRRVSSMLATLQSSYTPMGVVSLEWNHYSLKSDRASLGWLGWQKPNLTETHDIIVVVDGCIYNGDELGTYGTPAELIASLYREYDFRETLSKINGDFAIALYDKQERTLWLGRDRFGVCPLYYWYRGDSFAFASRPRALLALPEIKPEVNRRFVALFAASHYRTFDNDPHASPYAEIRQLPASHYLSFCRGKVSLESYWQLEEQPEWEDSPQVLAERYQALLLDSVARRLAVADRPAFTLSGGMDSSSVLACAVRSSGSRQQAFSTVYRDKTYDESEEISSMLESHVEKWHPIAIDVPDVFGLVEQMVALHDEPVATATWLSHFLLCQNVREQGFGSLFGGLGGDELNAGEYEYFPYYFADLAMNEESDRLDRELRKWSEYHDHPIFRKSPEIGRQAIARLTDPTIPGRCLPDRERLQKYISALNPDYFNLGDFTPVMDHPFESYLKNRTYQDLFRETTPCCLRAEDRHANAFGLDRFVPFLDHRLVEFTYRVPGHLKIAEGVTKRLLRDAMKGILPKETRQRIKKTGWNAPAHLWFSGKGREQLLDLVRSQSFRDRGIYQPVVVETLIEEHQTAIICGNLNGNHMMFLWQLVNLELWLSNLSRTPN
ncbi:MULTISPECIES: asparagine synthase-related protein [Spirulina sp. CCY15215]|uniref:asparagine synthetase B family protein n=1 Tax=Spirulina sp. CCY15215 TaxID=2767591 RepID=UPI0019522DFD